MFFIAYIGDKAMGLIGGIDVNGEFELISMWVNPSSRGLNLGTSLIKTLQSHALSVGYSSVVLKVSRHNVSAYRLYKKSGFIAVVDQCRLKSDDEINLQKMTWCNSE